MTRFSRQQLLLLASVLFLLAGVIELCVRQWAFGAMWIGLAILYAAISRRRCSGSKSVQAITPSRKKSYFQR